MKMSIGRWAAAAVISAALVGAPAHAVVSGDFTIGGEGQPTPQPIADMTGGEVVTATPSPQPTGFVWTVSGDGLIYFANTITSAPGSLGGSVIVRSDNDATFQFGSIEYALASLDPQVPLFSLKVFGFLDGNLMATTLLQPGALGDYTEFGPGGLAGVDIDELRFGLDGARLSFDEDGFPVRHEISMSIRSLGLGFDGQTAGVPEPESWALMIAGFGLVGAAVRRRKVGVA